MPLLSALAGTAAALAGVYLKAILDRKDKIQERVWSKEDKTHDEHRARVEELYTHLDKYCSLFASRFINYGYWLEGKVDGNGLDAMNEKLNSGISHDLTKLKFLTSAYFPELMDEYTALLNKIAVAHEVTKTFETTGSTLLSQRPKIEDVMKFKGAVSRFETLRLNFAIRVSRQVESPPPKQAPFKKT